MNTLQAQRDNTAFLLTDVIPWMLANPDRVDLDETHSECGRFACLGGWYSLRKYSIKWNEALPADADDHKEFGINDEQWCQFFGGKLRGTLQERTPIIQAHLDDLNLRIATE